MRLRLDLLSDTLFASGYGLAHHLDADVEHDLRTGLPFVRGRTLKGLLTEGCAEVLRGLGEAALDAPLVQAGLEAFGGPGSTDAGRGRLRVGSARLPGAFCEAVQARRAAGAVTTEHVLGALTTVRRRTAIDEATGTAAEGSLRAQRMLQKGLVFEAPLDGDGLSAEARFLVALAAGAVQRAGTGRARGAGHVRLSVWEGETNLTEAAVAALEAAGDGRPVVPPAFAAPAAAAAAPEGAVGGTVLRVRVRLDEPLLVRGAAGDPNTGVGLPCIPGSALRGAAIGRYLARAARGIDLAADAAARRRFFDGGIAFLGAYPVAGGRRSVPTPASWFADKGDAAWGADAARGLTFEKGPAERQGGDDATWQWRRQKAPFVVPGDAPVAVRPARVVNVHIQRARGFGLQDEAARAVFRYDALAEGQVFEALVVCADAALCAEAATWFPVGARLSFGRSGTAGYGAATVVSARVEAALDETALSDTASAAASGAASGAAVVVFTAPVAVRDPETGVFTTDPAALGAALGGTVEAVWGQTARPSGFNRTWGLPLPQHPVWAAGTTVRLVGVDAAALAARQRTGVGERRADGFGRFVVDAGPGRGPTWRYGPAVDGAWTTGAPSDAVSAAGASATGTKGPGAAAGLDGRAAALVQRLDAHVAARRAADAIAARAHDVAAQARRGASGGRLTRTQIERMQRLVQASASRDAAAAALRDELARMPQDARRKWRSVRLDDGRRLEEWLQGLVDGSEATPWAEVQPLVLATLALLARSSASVD